jgi:hypothetical protein
MPENICPNINTCRLVTTSEVVPEVKEKEAYLDTWCKDTEGKWLNCKRYITKATLGFCPDFVVPGTTLSIDEIIDKFDEQ